MSSAGWLALFREWLLLFFDPERWLPAPQLSLAPSLLPPPPQPSFLGDVLRRLPWRSLWCEPLLFSALLLPPQPLLAAMSLFEARGELWPQPLLLLLFEGPPEVAPQPPLPPPLLPL
jgi:hypothetical protein